MFTYKSKCLQEFESLKLSYVIDECSDAAEYKMIDTNDIHADYSNYSNLKVNPQVALDTFVDVFCFNYDMYPDDENRQLVMNKYIPNFTVAGFDGYWMAQPSCIEDTNNKTRYSLVFTPKLPYKAKVDNNYYALNMGGTDTIKLNSGTKGGFTRVKNSNLPSDINDFKKRQAIINNTLTTNIGIALDSMNADESIWHNEFYIPSNLTDFTNVNPVTGPTVLALVENVDLTTGEKADAFSITGSKVMTARTIVTYTRDGDKYYCYADKLLNKDGSSLFPFLQFDRESQRYYWWDYPSLKFRACDSRSDFERLKSHPNSKRSDMTLGNVHAYLPTKDKDETVTITGMTTSKKDAVSKGYKYDYIAMRRS